MFPRSQFEPLRKLRDRIKAEEANERAEVAAGLVTSTVAGLPTPGQAGRMRFATDGRKVGEGAGAGTGTPAYDDGVAWRRTADDTTVLA